MNRVKRAVFEPLESRRLLAGDINAGVALPYFLDFNRSKDGVLDRDGTGTGMTWVQPNRNGDEYQSRLIDVKIGVGVLRLYTTGTADSGSNFEDDNTAVNVLNTRFAASSKAWVVSARLLGPIPQIDQPHEQGGIIFGPDQENYVKLVAAAENGQVGLQFLDEQKFSTGYRHDLPSTIYDIGSFSSIQTLDLYLAGDPKTGIVRALYRINGGTVKELSAKLTLGGDKKGVFFSNAGFAGVMAQHKNNGGGIDVTFDQFAIQRGVLNGETEQTSGDISTASRRVFNDVRGGSGQQIGVAVRNEGNGPLTIPAGGLTISGTDASMFSVSSVDGLPVTIPAGGSSQIKLTFSATSGTSLGIKTATLAIASNDSDTPVKTVALRGLATNGTGGTNEPSLQRVLDLYEIPVNVGDANPSDVYIGDPPSTPNDELTIQQFRKAGAGEVTIQPIAVFGVTSNPALRLGYYEPGSPTKQTELFTVSTADVQTVNPVPNGATSFDPGSEAFSFYSIWPGFANTDNTLRTIYQEDIFNTFDTNEARHIRFYPFKNSDGSVVPNAYVMAHEEFPGGYDAQDIVAIITNVTPTGSGAEIGTENLDGYPDPDRLVFNRFRNPDPNFPNTAKHDQAKVRVRNTGTDVLNISSFVTSGAFSVVSPTGAQTVNPGKFIDVLVKFNGDSVSGVRTGTLTINSNDADESAKVITLAGFNQLRPEDNREADLATMMNGIFGYTTSFESAGHDLSNGGKVEAVGDEVLSAYWFRANTLLPIKIKQLTAFHTQGNIATLGYHNKGSNTVTALFASAGVDAQTLFPRKDGNLNQFAEASLTPGSTAIGFRVDGNEWSDPKKNVQEQPGGGYGHHLRFFKLKNARGQFVPDTYLLVMDYAGINYDYNDNTYIISNIRPETAQSTTQSSSIAAAVPPQSASFSTTPVKPSDAAELLDSLKNL